MQQSNKPVAPAPPAIRGAPIFPAHQSKPVVDFNKVREAEAKASAKHFNALQMPPGINDRYASEAVQMPLFGK